MTIRKLQPALLFACSAITLSAQGSRTQEPEPFAAVNSQQTQILSLSARGPSLVVSCECDGLFSSTGNLYFTESGINASGPSVASFYRTGKYSLPGSEGLLDSESGPPNFYFGNVVWAYVAGNYYGYFVANYDRSGIPFSQIKRVPLGGGPPVVLATSPAYVGFGDLATDGSTLFWADTGGVRSMPIYGGVISTLVTSTAVSHIALDVNAVYYSEGNLISIVAKTGGPVLLPPLAGAAEITALYVWSYNSQYSNIIWGEQGGAVRSNDNHGSNQYTWQNPISGRYVTSVGYDGTKAVWIDCAQNPQCNVSVQNGGPQPTTINAGVGASHLQWDATSIYWIAAPGIQRFVF